MTERLKIREQIPVPHCPLHVATSMVLVPMPDIQRNHQNVSDRKEKAAALARRAWRCPLAGCGRVAPHLPSDDEAAKMARKPCPHCGKPSDGCGRLHGDRMCRACRRIYLRKRRTELKTRAAKKAQEAA